MYTTIFMDSHFLLTQRLLSRSFLWITLLLSSSRYSSKEDVQRWLSQIRAVICNNPDRLLKCFFILLYVHLLSSTTCTERDTWKACKARHQNMITNISSEDAIGQQI